MAQLQLTETQSKAACATKGNVCVSAGAGTGKTRVLVERFLLLVERSLARPHEILAITFTEKAAQEMKERIAKRLRERELEDARRELEGAYIGTIHSFCARILREHPIEARVDPAFRVLEEDEADLWKEAALDEMIENRFQEAPIFELLHAYGETGVRDAIRSFMDRSHAFGLKLREIKNIKRAEPGFDPKNGILEALEQLEKKKGKQDDCAFLREWIGKTTFDWDLLEALKRGGKRFRRQGSDQIDFRSRLDRYVAYLADVLSTKTRETFLSLAQDAETRYQKRKEERSALDFNDLERKAADLLGGETPSAIATRNLYRKNFKFIMVDEFQDTSPVQDRVISWVAQSDNLFIVGDWKQSIFGFRGAEASLFLGKQAAYSKASESTCISLAENFRSLSGVLNPINSFFEHLWRDEKNVFEPLQATRFSPETQDPAVQFLSIVREEEDNMEAARMREARHLAGRIEQMAASGAYDYRDFAMLFRVSTDIYFYEHELKQLGIPYYVVSGRGFYHQHEIRDLISFLELLDNPHLDIPLAAVLRSPLVQVTDDALFWLANASKRANPESPLYHGFLKSDEIQELSNEDRSKLNRFKHFFLSLLREKEKWTLSELLERILEETRYDRYVLSLPQGKRHFANIRKLLEIAREAEVRESLHLGDFIRYVRGLETKEVRESEAQVEALEGNVVKLMTIHKAKGLEFKVVILPDLNRKGEKCRGRFLIDPEYGIGISGLNEKTRDFEETLTFQMIKQRMIEKSHEESKRLLYVGMTRAEDRLILSGVQTKGSREISGEGFDDGANWYEWIDRWMSETGGFKREVIPLELKQKKRRVLPLAERKNIKTQLTHSESLPVKSSDEAEQLIERLGSIHPVYFERIDLPVTAFSTFEHNPDEYRRTYELGMLPEENQKIEEWMEDGDEETLSASDFGTVTHRIFELLVSHPEKARDRLDTYMARFAAELSETEKLEITNLSKTFIQSTLFDDILKAKKRYAEIPFVLRLKGGVIQGTLDLLYERPDGSWVIVDYKTTRVEGDDLEKASEPYRTQMMFYALACYELAGISPKRAALYFVRPNRTFDFLLDTVDFSKLKADLEKRHDVIIRARKAWIT